MNPERLKKSVRSSEKQRIKELAKEEKRRTHPADTAWSQLVVRNRKTFNRTSRLLQAGRQAGDKKTVIRLSDDKSELTTIACIDINAGANKADSSRAFIRFFAVKPEDVAGLRMDKKETWQSYKPVAVESSYQIKGAHIGGVDPEGAQGVDELQNWDNHKNYSYRSGRIRPVKALGEQIKLRKISTVLDDLEDSLTMVEAAASDDILNLDLSQALLELDESQAIHTA